MEENKTEENANQPQNARQASPQPPEQAIDERSEDRAVTTIASPNSPQESKRDIKPADSKSDTQLLHVKDTVSIEWAINLCKEICEGYKKSHGKDYASGFASSMGLIKDYLGIADLTKNQQITEISYEDRQKIAELVQRVAAVERRKVSDRLERRVEYQRGLLRGTPVEEE